MATLLVVEDLAGPASLGRGGHATYVLQWLHGLERLGHRVIHLEFVKPDGHRDGAMRRYFEDTIGRCWHLDRSALLLENSGESLCGLTTEQVTSAAREAEAVITLAAHYRQAPYPLIDRVRPRILIEQDPGYTHLWAVGGDPADVYGEHDCYFTVGGNVGSPRCLLPTLGIRWQPVWNPVVLDWWDSDRPLVRDRFTTVADWRSYGYLEFEGQMLGPKAEEFRKFIRLPDLAGESLEIALNIDAADPDLAYLRENGWHVEDPSVVSTPEQYREFIEGSRGEFSCVKGGYAGTNGGWFSDRSACYLAAGRPVVLQATGFADLLPTGRGLFSVASAEEAAEAIKAVRRDYALHSAAAREIAREHFDSDKVVGGMLARAGIGGGETVPHVLVIAPHPDDESIGCGGVICLHQQRGERVGVVFLTSGERGIEGVGPDRVRAIREAEALEAMSVLGIEEHYFLRLPDLGLSSAVEEGAQRLRGVLEAARPEIVYLPHPGEAHPDHQATLPIVRAALGQTRQVPELRAYEVWTPMERHDWPEDVSAVMERKLQAVRCYRSQLETFRYDDAVEGLDRFRGCLAARCRYAEVFRYVAP